MILFQLHHMWYESEMIEECWDSIIHALENTPEIKVSFNICFNLQTYLEVPTDRRSLNLFEKFKNHKLVENYKPKFIFKTDEDSFYNIGDWRREVYDSSAKYTVWGESDTIIPKDFFYILDKLDLNFTHLLTFAGRPMWDNSWDIVTHESLLGYSKPCQCQGDHRTDCIELLEPPFKYKDYINQEDLDKFNDKSDDIKIQQVPLKIDGSLVCISKNFETPFIAPEMHFVREDTCLENFCRIKNIPQLCVINRMKGHNYWHPKKRTGTNSTRNDKIFKQYSEQSIQSMNNFLQTL